jgi:hypothetical protein
MVRHYPKMRGEQLFPICVATSPVQFDATDTAHLRFREHRFLDRLLQE